MGSFGEQCSFYLPPPEPFPDLLQCLNVSIVSSAACQALFPGKITDNMVCASGADGADACQVSECRLCTVTLGQEVGDRAGRRGREAWSERRGGAGYSSKS